jgi:hypothetical protein
MVWAMAVVLSIVDARRIDMTDGCNFMGFVGEG